MAENAKDAGKKRNTLAVNFGKLVAQIAHQCLCHSQSNKAFGHITLPWSCHNFRGLRRTALPLTGQAVAQIFKGISQISCNINRV